MCDDGENSEKRLGSEEKLGRKNEIRNFGVNAFLSLSMHYLAACAVTMYLGGFHVDKWIYLIYGSF